MIDPDFQPLSYGSSTGQPIPIAKLHYPESQWGEAISLYASHTEGGFAYEASDFYGNEIVLEPGFSPYPLTLGNLIVMIENMKPAHGQSIGNLELTLLGIPEASSDLYPGLGEYFEGKKESDLDWTSLARIFFEIRRLVCRKKSLFQLKIQNRLVGEGLDMVRLEPIVVGLKRNAVIEVHPLELHVLDGLWRQPTPKIICLIDGELGKLDDFLAIDDHGDQSHCALYWYVQMNLKIPNMELMQVYPCVNFRFWAYFRPESYIQ